MHVAKELGLPLCDLNRKVTLEELQLWAAFFEIESDKIKKAEKRR
jgi:hypothetical protein